VGKAALADSRRADHSHRLGAGVADGAVEQRLQLRDLDITPDHRRPDTKHLSRRHN
jgi:hypothetical protein